MSKSIIFINHVTIDTGNTRKSPRSEVTNDVVKLLKKWLSSSKPIKMPGAPDGSFVNQIPCCAGFTALITPRGRSLIVSVLHHFRPCVTFAVAPDSTSGAKMWEVLDGKQNPPQAPFCAVRFEVGMGLMPHEDLMWLGDFERSVAWAWLERK